MSAGCGVGESLASCEATAESTAGGNLQFSRCNEQMVLGHRGNFKTLRRMLAAVAGILDEHRTGSAERAMAMTSHLYLVLEAAGRDPKETAAYEEAKRRLASAASSAIPQTDFSQKSRVASCNQNWSPKRVREVTERQRNWLREALSRLESGSAKENDGGGQQLFFRILGK